MIIFDYQVVHDGVVQFSNAMKKFEGQIDDYSTLINNIGNSDSWVSSEKDSVVTIAKAQYLKFFDSSRKNIQNLMAQVENKISDFEEAENIIKGMSI